MPRRSRWRRCALGAEVIHVPGRYGNAETEAIRVARESGRIYVSAYNDPAVMAGAGTIGLDVVKFLRAAAMDAEARHHFVEDQESCVVRGELA